MSLKLLEERGHSFFKILGDLEYREEALRGLAVRIGEDSRVLDIATGSGYLIRNMLKKRLHIVCVDINSSALASLKRELASQKKKCSLYYVCADAANLPFKRDSFDICVSWSGLIHIDNWRKAVGEMFRVATEVAVLEPIGGYAVRAFRDFSCSHRVPELLDMEMEFRRFGSVNIKRDKFIVEIVGEK